MSSYTPRIVLSFVIILFTVSAYCLKAQVSLLASFLVCLWGIEFRCKHNHHTAIVLALPECPVNWFTKCVYNAWNGRGFVWIWMNKHSRQTDEKSEQEGRRFCVYAHVFLAVNQYANEAWSVILLQLISLNPSSPGLGTAHTHWHSSLNTTHKCSKSTLFFTHLYIYTVCNTFHRELKHDLNRIACKVQWCVTKCSLRLTIQLKLGATVKLVPLCSCLISNLIPGCVL